MLLELRTLMLCLVQLSKWNAMPRMLKSFSLMRKVAKCNFKSKAQVHEICFFLMKWNVICNVEDRFSCVRAFCRASHVRAFNAQNHWFRAYKNTNAVFCATKQMRESRPRMLKASFSWEKVAKCNFKSNAQVHERYFFLMKWNVICNADRFSCLELFLRAKNTNAVRAKNTCCV